MKQSIIAASEFKAKCLRLLDEVAEQGATFIVTKRGRAIAKVAPISRARKSTRGQLEGNGEGHGGHRALQRGWRLGSHALMSSLLPDTHILAWWRQAPGRLSRDHSRALEAAEKAGEAFGISAITLWELANRLGPEFNRHPADKLEA